MSHLLKKFESEILVSSHIVDIPDTNISHLLKKFESEILVSGISTIWEDTKGSANQYR